MSNLRFSQQELLRDYKVVFDNLQTQEIIKTEMAEYGYDATEIAKGKTLYDTANALYLKNIKEDQEETVSHAVFSKNFEQLVTELLSTIEVFYTTLQQSENLKTPLNRLKITDEHITSQLAQFTQTNASYSDYVREKGENQDATKHKEEAIKALEEWMREFYSIAKIALEDHPQLLESVAKFIRS